MAWVVFAAMYPLYGLLPYVLSSCIGYKDLNLPLTKMVSVSFPKPLTEKRKSHLNISVSTPRAKREITKLPPLSARGSLYTRMTNTT